MTTHGELRIVSDGTQASVHLDDVELCDGIGSYTLTHRHGELPRLRVDPLILTGGVVHSGWVLAEVAPAARAVLESLGWIPPAEDVPACGHYVRKPDGEVVTTPILSCPSCREAARNDA